MEDLKAAIAATIHFLDKKNVSREIRDELIARLVMQKKTADTSGDTEVAKKAADYLDGLLKGDEADKAAVKASGYGQNEEAEKWRGQ